MGNNDTTSNVSSDEMLTEYEEQNISLLRLIKSLLSTSTMPHLVLIVAISSIFYVLAGVSAFTTTSAMAFTSLSLAYAATALLSRNNRVKSWITLSEENRLATKPSVKSVLNKFRICLFPVTVSVVIFFGIMVLSGENGIISNADNMIPSALGLLFIAWSIVQGVSFSQWASANSAKHSSRAKRPGNLRISIVLTLTIIGVFSLVLGTLFYQFDNLSNTITESVTSALLFVILATIVCLASIGYSWRSKNLASMKNRLHYFSNRWSIICHLFITWHLLTIWRQNFLDPSAVQVFLEEIVLMIFTVIFAIWSMTSKGYKSSFRMITEENALTWGLSFGYAYAGSVAMLTSFFDDIKTVMLIGHSIVVITVIILHKRVLQKIIGVDDYDVEIQRISSDNTQDSESTRYKAKASKVTSGVEETDHQEWQEDDDVDWEAGQTAPQIEGVDWDEAIDLD